MNNELRQMGIGVKNISDYDKAIGVIVRRTFRIKTLLEVEPIADEVELFVLELLEVIKKRRNANEETVLQDP